MTCTSGAGLAEGHPPNPYRRPGLPTGPMAERKIPTGRQKGSLGDLSSLLPAFPATGCLGAIRDRDVLHGWLTPHRLGE